MTSDYYVEERSASDIVRAIQSRRTTSEAVIRAHLARIDAFDKRGPAINAIVEINDNALDDARTLDRRFVREGPVGPLHGVPVVLKDNFEARSTAVTGGARALAAHRPERDAFVVRRLREAGAVVLAKANLHELALGGTTASSLGGQTLNPYDLSRTPGGSSGGTGAAIASSYCVAGLGSDTVNSIRSPASALHLVGIRPTRGLVSRSGVIPVSPTQDAVGPIARCVEDVALMLDAIAGYDAGDPSTASGINHRRNRFTPNLRANELHGLRVGLCLSLIGSEARHVEVSDAVMRAARVMERAGARLVEMKTLRIDVPALIRDADVQLLEFKSAINRYFARSPGCPVKSLHEFLAVNAKLGIEAGDFLRNAENIGRREHAAQRHLRLARIAEWRERLFAAMARYHVDVLVYPLQRSLVAPVGAGAQPDRNGIVASLSGFPAIDIPAGFSGATQSAPCGVPIGMDILGTPWSEQRLLNVAYSLESLLQARQAPASTPPL
jgi:Asp-tRNA(Asn)/Glu-tRNA(Gln) amidotransferase A subunit family amidase